MNREPGLSSTTAVLQNIILFFSKNIALFCRPRPTIMYSALLPSPCMIHEWKEEDELDAIGNLHKKRRNKQKQLRVRVKRRKAIPTHEPDHPLNLLTLPAAVVLVLHVLLLSLERCWRPVSSLIYSYLPTNIHPYCYYI